MYHKVDLHKRFETAREHIYKKNHNRNTNSDKKKNNNNINNRYACRKLKACGPKYKVM